MDDGVGAALGVFIYWFGLIGIGLFWDWLKKGIKEKNRSSKKRWTATKERDPLISLRVISGSWIKNLNIL